MPACLIVFEDPEILEPHFLSIQLIAIANEKYREKNPEKHWEYAKTHWVCFCNKQWVFSIPESKNRFLRLATSDTLLCLYCKNQFLVRKRKNTLQSLFDFGIKMDCSPECIGNANQRQFCPFANALFVYCNHNSQRPYCRPLIFTARPWFCDEVKQLSILKSIATFTFRANWKIEQPSRRLGTG